MKICTLSLNLIRPTSFVYFLSLVFFSLLSSDSFAYTINYRIDANLSNGGDAPGMVHASGVRNISGGGWHALNLPEPQWGVFDVKSNSTMTLFVSVDSVTGRILTLDNEIDLHTRVTDANIDSNNRWTAISNTSYNYDFKLNHKGNTNNISFRNNETQINGLPLTVNRTIGNGTWTGDGSYGIGSAPFILDGKATDDGTQVYYNGLDLRNLNLAGLKTGDSFLYASWFMYNNGFVDFYLRAHITNISTSNPVPEPFTLALLSSAMGGALLSRKRNRVG